MKKIGIALLLLAGITASAQHQDRKDHKNAMKDLTPEQIATLQTKKMALALDLNESQQTKIKALFISNAEMRKEKMEAHKIKKESGTPLTSDEKYSMQKERLDHQIAQKEEMKKLLTDEQYSKWEKMQHRKGKHKREKAQKSKKESN